ncbi:MAG TPA: hypothetical protein VF475_11855 [Sphingobium sp.]
MNKFTIGVLVTVAAASAVLSSGFPGQGAAAESDAAKLRSPKTQHPAPAHGTVAPDRLASARG